MRMLILKKVMVMMVAVVATKVLGVSQGGLLEAREEEDDVQYLQQQLT